jgi:hypothetical protein
MAETCTRDLSFLQIVRGLGWWMCLGMWTAALLTSYPAHIGKGMIPLAAYLPVSKLVHVAAYAFLAFCLPWVASRRWRWRLLALLSLHAAATEYLQQFVPGRTGKISDVVIDHIGLLLAFAMTWRCWLPRPHARPTAVAASDQQS